MSRNKAFNHVSYHPRASIIPHPDALREHFGHDLSDSDVTAAYLMKRTIEGADVLNPYKDKVHSKKYSAYHGYLDNEALLMRNDPTYRPARSAISLRNAAMDDIAYIREDNECATCRKEIPEGTGYCDNGVC